MVDGTALGAGERRRVARLRPGRTKRELIGLLAASALPVIARAATSRPRIVTLDWAVAETLVALGSPPLGSAEIANYDRTVVDPAMPAGVVDLGLRLSPNAELMQRLRPDLVLINPAQAYLRASLAPFGSVEVVPIYTAAGDPYRLAGEAATRLAGLCGDPQAAVSLLERADAEIATARERLRPLRGRSVYVVGFVDGKHVTVAGRTSLFQGVLDRLGLRNAWQGASSMWGIAQVGLEALAAEPDAHVIYRTPVPDDAKRTIASSPFWAHLPAVRAGRTVALPPIWSYGGLPSAMRFARLLAEALPAADAPG